MATPRELKSRINGVQNTKKITRTMEMVSTAKSKKTVNRVAMSQPYALKVQELIQTMAAANVQVEHPLLRKVEKPRKAGILVIAANRGLCGGYNNNIIDMAIARSKELQGQGVEVETRLIGKKAMGVYRFQKQPFKDGYTNIDDKPTFEEARIFADYYLDAFSNKEMDLVEIVYTKYHSSSKQKPYLLKLLPISLDSGLKKEIEAQEPYTEKQAATQYVFEPNPEKILQELLPRIIRISFYQAMLEAVASEQIARRIAMKNATDAASDMIKMMNREYNKARQAKITQEISEIVGGADAV